MRTSVSQIVNKSRKTNKTGRSMIQFRRVEGLWLFLPGSPPFFFPGGLQLSGAFYTLSVMICDVGEQGITDEVQKIPYGYPLYGAYGGPIGGLVRVMGFEGEKMGRTPVKSAGFFGVRG